MFRHHPAAMPHASTPLRRALCAGLASALLLAAPLQARAADASAAASALSALPVAVVVAAPVALLSAGTVVTVTALGTGLLLSAAGQALAFVPNAVGAALMHNERVTK